MKSFFIYNPIAGSGKKESEFMKKIEELKTKYENIYLYKTTGVGDATKIAKELTTKYPNETINIFACGGDGTCNEVVNGIAESKNVNFGIIPTGSCNDFLKNFPNIDFMDIEGQLLGNVKKIDVLKANSFYCLNVCNIGFDAKVNYDQIQLRTKYHDVKKAYNKAIFKNIIRKNPDDVVVKVDGSTIYDGKTLLMVLGNGEHYGGSFRPFQNTSLCDGIIDLMIVKNVGILKFASLLGKYKIGECYNNPKVKVVKSAKAKTIEIESKDTLTICLDGETFFNSHVTITNLHNQMNFIIPKNN